MKMSKSAFKKLILLSSVALLFVIFIFQQIFNGRNKMYTLQVKKPIDEISIEHDGRTVLLKKDGENWSVASKDFPDETFQTEANVATSIEEAIRSVRVVGTASRGISDRSERYGLSESERITVTASSKGKIQRVLKVGKDSSSGNQSYIQSEKKSAILIANKPLHSVFNKTVSSLRYKQLYSISPDSISTIIVKNEEGRFSLMKSMNTEAELNPESGSGISSQQAQWTLSENTTELVDPVLDQGNIGNWVSSLAELSVSEWTDSLENLPVNIEETEPVSEIQIGVGAMPYDLKFYAIESDESKMLCKSNQNKYPFYVARYNADKFIKKLSDLTVKFEVPAEVESTQGESND